MGDIFAPPGGWRVRILDLSGGAEDNIVGGGRRLPDPDAGQRLRPQLRARQRGAVPASRACRRARCCDVWFAFGEDAEVLDAASRLAQRRRAGRLLRHPASEEERDWRSLDPGASRDRPTKDAPTPPPPPVRQPPPAAWSGRRPQGRRAAPTCLRTSATPGRRCSTGCSRAAIGGRFLLRLDDTDRRAAGRSSRRRSQADLPGSASTGTARSARPTAWSRYEAAAEALKRAGRLYPCFESEDELPPSASSACDAASAPIYDRAMLTHDGRPARAGGGERQAAILAVPAVRRRARLGRPRARPPRGQAVRPVRPRAGARRRHAPLHLHLRGRRHPGRDHPRHPRRGPHQQHGRPARPPRGPAATVPAASPSRTCPCCSTTKGASCPSGSAASPCAEPARRTASSRRRSPPTSPGSARPTDPVPMALDALVADFDITRFADSPPRFDIRAAAGAQPPRPARGGRSPRSRPACRPAPRPPSGSRCAATSTC